MNLFGGNNKQTFSNHCNNQRQQIGHINTNINNLNNSNNNNSFLFNSNNSTSSRSINNINNKNGDGNKTKSNVSEENIEVFLRYRSELYFSNGDYDTGLFFAERLLSEKDSLSNRLLVAKCYKQLSQFNRAYHVLQSLLRQKQTDYQRYLTKKKLQTQNPQRNQIEQPNNNISFNIDPLTPIANDPNANHNISGIGFAFTYNPTSDSTNTTSDIHNGSFALNFLNDNVDKEMDPEEVKVLFEARYFLSLVCFELGRYDECEEFLLGKKYSDSHHLELEIPNGVYGVYLLAKVFHKSSRFDLAIEFYQKCLNIDSYHFGAIMALSQLGKDPGLTKQSQPTQALQSKDCKIPIKNDIDTKINNENKESNEIGTKYVELEKYDFKSYSKLKSLFDNLSWGYFKLQMFYPQDALKYFNKLPSSHFSSAWVLNNTARCYYEMNDYSRV